MPNYINFIGKIMLGFHLNSSNKDIYFFFYFSYGYTAQFWALASSIKLSVSFQCLDLGQSAGLLGRVIRSSQGVC
jgi:hypothetical protein